MNNYGAQTTMVSEPKQPEAISVTNRFMDVNQRHRGMLDEIQAKLHGLYNRREPTPEVNGGGKEKSMDTDFFSTMNMNLNIMEQNYQYLSRILDHLNHIL